MKRFGDSFIMPRPPKAFTIWKGLLRRVQRYRIAFATIMLVMAVSFVLVILQIIVTIPFLPVNVLSDGLLLSLPFLVCLRILPLMGHTNTLKEISMADLLERDVTPLQAAEARAVLKGRVVLVTGAAGSIGSELCRQVLNYEPALLIALDNNETGLFDLSESLRTHPHYIHLYLHICDITDYNRLVYLFQNKHPELIFHAAAYKHVPLLEHFPDQAIRTNALATYHLCLLARAHRVARFVFVSTDKAAAPTSVMGATKRIGELIMQALANSEHCETCFCAVRFGNVIGSRGSVVPIFAQQIARGGPVTVTDPVATRYFMTIPEACGLVISTAALASQGGLYLLEMGKPVRIVDLATRMIQLYNLRVGRDITIVYTGLRPGEHLHETLVGTHEVLVPTAHNKISCVHHEDALPTLATLAQWMDTLGEHCQQENHALLRRHLFAIVRVQELIVTR